MLFAKLEIFMVQSSINPKQQKRFVYFVVATAVLWDFEFNLADFQLLNSEKMIETNDCKVVLLYLTLIVKKKFTLIVQNFFCLKLPNSSRKSIKKFLHFEFLHFEV